MDNKKKYGGSRKKTIPMIISCSIIFLLVGIAIGSTDVSYTDGVFWSRIDNTIVLTNESENVNIGENATTDYRLKVNGTSYFSDTLTVSGVVILHGDARVKRHVRITAPSWQKGVSEPVDAFIGITPVLSFDKSNDDAVHYSIITPYRIETGSNVTINVDWCYTGVNDVGTVNWNLSYIHIGVGDSVDGALSYVAQTTTGTHTSGKLVRTEFTENLTGAIAHYDIGLMLIRDVSEDTLDTDAHLIQVHFCFTEDKLGIPV